MDKRKNRLTYIVVVVVFFLQLKKGLGPNEEPFVAVISALMAACAALVTIEVIVWVWSNYKKRRR